MRGIIQSIYIFYDSVLTLKKSLSLHYISFFRLFVFVSDQTCCFLGHSFMISCWSSYFITGFSISP